MVTMAKWRKSSRPARERVAGRNLHCVLDARVVGEDGISACAVTKQADDGGMGAVQDAKDSALGALCPRDAGPPLHLYENVISVHGVFDGIARDVHVAIELGNGSIRNHKAITVGMKDQAALQFIAIARRRVRRRLSGRSKCLRLGFACKLPSRL